MDVLARPFAAVLFDMDGTLISSLDSVVRAWRRLAQEFAIPAERFGDFHGIPARALLDLLMPDRPLAERQRALARITALEIADVAGVTALPGAADALGALAPGGRCAVVTSASGALARARLAASGLPVPAVVVTADDVHRGKPDPEPFTIAAARLGVDPAACLVVEDATSGITAARAAGAATVAVTTTTPGIQADVVVPDLAALWFSVGVDGVGVRWAPERLGR
jgi:sugar-phosphatase